jgi:NADH-quinone oxidoreductase subunit N
MKKEAGHKFSYVLSIATLVFVAVQIMTNFSTDATIAFNNMFIDDPMADLLKIAICLISAAVFVYSRQYNQDRDIFKGEYYVLGLFGVAGMMVMASANHLLTLYLGLELMSLCLYAMIAFYRDDKLAVESAMKYFVLGALASSVLLYGMSLLYGLTGSLELATIRSTLAGADQSNVAIALAVVFIVVAVGFKLGAVPFHMWVPDVYQGAPTSTTAFVGAAPKIAAFAMTMRLLAGGLEDLHGMWQQMLIIIALLSIAAGNIIAIAQSNLKRMLAYSTISHMGYFLCGILAGTAAGYSASLFYVLVYSVMSLAAFGIVLYLATKNNESDQLSDLKGLSKRSPWTAFLLLILMLSMAGIPPTAGFFAKFSIIQALVNANLIWVAIVAVILAVVGAYYYLRIIKLAYFDPPEDQSGVVAGGTMSAVLTINILLIVAILPWIGTLLTLCNEVISKFSV